MITKVVENPNSKSSHLLDQLKHIETQNKEYAKYDVHAPSFKEDEVETFYDMQGYMLNKILVIIIILILSFLIYQLK